ncbi:hypothetical protein [Natronosalvus rutilus]|uniref:Uncharacterized protein n=1 Tax=Natronosalvus rutilus TaxID=2953753 RepID=A0A9E7N5R4_9EURY|nr:hypothetical protein [Natronosalvus rutilus]UTF52244.1 hypothetical protein NGM29_10595 [Natronosalvus rutilus]
MKRLKELNTGESVQLDYSCAAVVNERFVATDYDVFEEADCKAERALDEASEKRNRD